MKKLLPLAGLTMMLALAFSQSAMAYSIDYLAGTISPAAEASGSSDNFQMLAPVAPGATISLNVSFVIKKQGSTTHFPVPVTFGSQTNTASDGISKPLVTFGAAPGTSTVSHTFTGDGDQFTSSITVIAPMIPGAYLVRISELDGAGQGTGLEPGRGVQLHFTVQKACANANTVLTLTVNPECVYLHATTTVFTANLTSVGLPVAGKLIAFTVDNVAVGQAYTAADGNAVLNFNPGALAVGDHLVAASFQGDACDYNASSASANLGVMYLFLGFQQPINADGSSVFKGISVPVKIKIADANGQPVPDAEAHVFFTYLSTTPVGTEQEAVSNSSTESGNLMRYVPADNQYIFNWSVAGLVSGTYSIRIGLGEGSCADPHTVIVSLKRK